MGDKNRQNLDKMLFQGLNLNFQKGFSEVQPVFTADMYEKTGSSSRENIYPALAQMPGFREWLPGQSREMRDVEMLDFKVPNRKFEATVRIYSDDIDDIQTGSYGLTAKMLGAETALEPDRLFAEMIEKGFTTVKTFDNVAWFSNSHSYGLSTIDNLTTALLSESAYAAAVAAMRSFKYQADKLSTARPLNPIMKLVLVVPPALEWTALKITDRERDTYGATSVIQNVGGTVKTLVVPWLTSSTKWYLFNIGNTLKPMIYQEREKFVLRRKDQSNSDDSFNNDDIIFGGKWRGATAPTLPWLAYASDGSATA